MNRTIVNGLAPNRNGNASATAYVFNHWISASIIIAMLAFLSACAGQPPKESVSQAELAVQQAMDSKATQLAPLDLRKARDHLNQANQAMQKKDYVVARRMAESAIVEAQLAQAKSDAQTAQSHESELRQSLETLKSGSTSQ
jgi:hypothetical protein